MKNNNKNVIIAVVIILVIIVIGIVWYTASQSTTTPSTQTQDQTASTTDNGQASTTSQTSGTGAASVSYQDALVTYASTRIQFDNQCQPTPKSPITFKNGTKVMFDNRSNVARTFNWGIGSVTIPAYGFSIVTLQSSTLPATLHVNCGANSKNVIDIVVQK